MRRISIKVITFEGYHLARELYSCAFVNVVVQKFTAMLILRSCGNIGVLVLLLY